MGTRQLMEVLGRKHRPTFVYEYLKPAIAEGWVEMENPKSPHSPTQKYRLTSQGVALLKKIDQDGKK